MVLNHFWSWNYKCIQEKKLGKNTEVFSLKEMKTGLSKGQLGKKYRYWKYWENLVICVLKFYDSCSLKIRVLFFLYSTSFNEEYDPSCISMFLEKVYFIFLGIKQRIMGLFFWSVKIKRVAIIFGAILLQ